MRYEEPNMEILMLDVQDVVTSSSLTGNLIGKDNEYQMPEGW